MRQYTVKNNSSLDTNTGLIGYLTINYNELLQEFGNPDDHSVKGNTLVRWVLHGTHNSKLIVATVYVYKERKPKEEITRWHIGGHNLDALKLVQEIFPGKTVQNWNEYIESLGNIKNSPIFTSSLKQTIMVDKKRDTFQSPYQEYKSYIGLKFTINSELDTLDKEETGAIYSITLENGITIDAWPEEIFEGTGWEPKN